MSLGLTAFVGAVGVLVSQAPAQAGPLGPGHSETGKAAAGVSCGSQAVTNADDGYIILGEDANLQKAPYAECGTYHRAKAGTKIWSWCTVENDYDNTWLWGRIDGTETYGWVYIEHAKELVEKPKANDGWCPNERPADLDELDGPDRIVEKAPAPDADDALPVEEFDPATDVDPAVPPVGGKQDGTMPADDYVAPEGDETNDPADGAPAMSVAAAKMKYGAPIKRAKVIARAKNWYSRNVPYSQQAFAWDVNKGKKFRTDCSGFVSMSWALKESRNTRNLDGVSYRINWSSLKPGDMVLRKGHVQLFEKWANKSRTSFWIYEEGSTASDMNHYKVKVSKAKSGGYKPWRYNKVRD
jgi:hypothetical protein